MLFSFYAIDPKCSSYQAEDLICFGGDCHVVVCPVEVTGKDNTQVLVFRELFDRFSINCISCSIEIKRWFSLKANMDKLGFMMYTESEMDLIIQYARKQC